jgi:hypothetical protein
MNINECNLYLYLAVGPGYIPLGAELALTPWPGYMNPFVPGITHGVFYAGLL